MPSGSKEEWTRVTLGPAIDRFPERQPKFVTDSGLDIEPLYVPEDLAGDGREYSTDVGYPGEYPYTRGVRPNS